MKEYSDIGRWLAQRLHKYAEEGLSYEEAVDKVIEEYEEFHKGKDEKKVVVVNAHRRTP